MMKKILFGFALLASVTACTEDYTDWVEPQSNAQDELLSFGDGSVAAVGVIDFAEIAEGQELVQVCSITAPSASDSGYAPEYLLTIGGTDFEIDAAGQVSVSELQEYVNNTFGRRPTEREMDATVSMWLNNGSTAVKQAEATFKITAKPVAPQISEMYYLIGGVEGTSWSVDDMSLPFSHSGRDVYDDPVFTITFPVEDGEYWFAFTDAISIAAYEATGDWSQVLGCAEGNGENGMEGKVARRAEIGDDGSFVVTVNGDAKFIRFTLNMMDYTYTIEKVNFGPYIYEIGNESGWATSNPLYCGDGNGGYQGYYYLNGEFKFKPNPGDDWNDDYECSGEGTLTQDGSDNCPDPGAGFYQINVDLAAMTYSLTEVVSITCVGNHNGWKETDASQHMTYNTELGCWEITTELTNGFKFAMNDGWAISWGGANDDPTAYNNLTLNNGKDLNVPEGDGTYLVQLYLSYEGNNRVEFTKQ